ncbi:MAG: hypothetical protein VX331_03970 [Candidatus Thermoplasmatota archaeon]|nr:hypothetical protein [Candidatus Thermoplasmatota archaeon]
MDELMDMMVSDESPSQISDTIKDMLYSKTAERVDAFRPVVANSLFGDDTEIEDEIEDDTEIVDQLDDEVEEEE